MKPAPSDTAKQTRSPVSGERRKKARPLQECAKPKANPCGGMAQNSTTGYEHRCLQGQNTRGDDTPLRGMVDGPLMRGRHDWMSE